MRTDHKNRRPSENGSDVESAQNVHASDDGLWSFLIDRYTFGSGEINLTAVPQSPGLVPMASPVALTHANAFELSFAQMLQPTITSPVDLNPNALSYHALGFEDGKEAPAPVEQPTAKTQGILVQFAAGVSADEIRSLIEGAGGSQTKIISAGDSTRGDLVRVDVALSAQSAFLDAIQNSAHVSFAEKDWSVGVQAVSNDSYYTNGSQWGVYGDKSTPVNAFGSQAAEAWASGKTGSAKVIVGDIDTGIDYTHPDLYLNVWLNQGEIRKDVALVDTDADGLITFRDLNAAQNAAYVSDINKNGRIDAGDLLKDTRWANRTDNDGNGYIDDLIGWDFVNNDNDPFDDNNHGTHTAGTIGAIGGNGTGVAGVNWSVGIMALKFMNAQGSGSLSSAIAALDYYTKISVLDKTPAEFIGTNNSWGGAGFSQALLDAITRSAKQDALFIAAAGNGGTDGIGDNNDISANYPSNYSTIASAGFESVIAVAALTNTGALASFSNYGATTVDLAAPGAGIYSTVAGGGYASYSGTSMATPHVTGALALMASIFPDYSAAQLRDLLLNHTAYTSALVGKTVTGGRLDVSAMLGDATSQPPISGTPSGSTIYGTSGNDKIVGTTGNDVIYGIANSTTNNTLGKGTVDILTGGAGNDIFVLGDGRGVFYNDGAATNAGLNDYALITDMTSSDKIQLKSGTYFVGSATVSGATGLGLYWDSNASGRYDARDEMIGLIQGVASVASSNFLFV